MNTRNIKTLAIVLVALLLGLFATRLTNDQNDSSGGGLLLPGLKAQINEISKVTIRKAGETATLRNDGGNWVQTERLDYPIDTGKLRQLILAVGDAKKLEEKTSNPEMYGRLGVEDIGDDSQGTEIRIAGADSETAVIIGNLAQRSYRYARVPGEEKSWLIDQDPTLPSGASGWLLLEILDIDQSRVQSVTITHADGETIRIEKENAADRDYKVPDIPDGRELSYPSIVDGIGGVLGGLNLQDVDKASKAEKDDSFATTVFTTFDGLEITIESSLREANTWVTVTATGSDSALDEAVEINARLNDWVFQLQKHKADQLRRRWTDILKAEE